MRVEAKRTASGPKVVIAGITGAVGQEFLRVLKERDFPYSEMKMLASARSAGSKVEFDGETYVVEELTESSFDGQDIALFSAGGSISKKFGPVAVEKGCFVVDNSSAFRMVDGVPLVIPEVNPEAMAHLKLGGKAGIIANPNCSTIIALMAVTPIHRAVGVERMVVSTYQAASGAGALAMKELEQQTREVVNDGEVQDDGNLQVAVRVQLVLSQRPDDGEWLQRGRDEDGQGDEKDLELQRRQHHRHVHSGAGDACARGIHQLDVEEPAR